MTKKDFESGEACKCEKCNKKIWYWDAYFWEYYEDRELTDFFEDEILCEICATKFFTTEELKEGVKKEYAYL